MPPTYRKCVGLESTTFGYFCECILEQSRL